MANLGRPITELCLTTCGTEIVLPLGAHVIGRSEECAVRIDDPLTSRRHAVLVVSAQIVVVRDMGSRNGVLVNGEEIAKEQTLVEGDLLTLGSQVFTVRRIRRAGEARSVPPPAPAPRSAPEPLARIAIVKRPVTESDDVTGTYVAPVEPATASTTLNQKDGLGRQAAAYDILAEAAARAIASQLVNRAIKILETPLQEVIEAARAGEPVDAHAVDFALKQALALCEACRGRQRLPWIDYVQDLYDALDMPIPLDVADRLARAMQLAVT